MNKLIALFSCLLIPSLSFSSPDVNKKYDVVATGQAMVAIIQYVSEDEFIPIFIYSWTNNLGHKYSLQSANLNY